MKVENTNTISQAEYERVHAEVAASILDAMKEMNQLVLCSWDTSISADQNTDPLTMQINSELMKWLGPTILNTGHKQ